MHSVSPGQTPVYLALWSSSSLTSILLPPLPSIRSSAILSSSVTLILFSSFLRLPFFPVFVAFFPSAILLHLLVSVILLRLPFPFVLLLFLLWFFILRLLLLCVSFSLSPSFLPLTPSARSHRLLASRLPLGRQSLKRNSLDFIVERLNVLSSKCSLKGISTATSLPQPLSSSTAAPAARWLRIRTTGAKRLGVLFITLSSGIDGAVFDASGLTHRPFTLPFLRRSLPQSLHPYLPQSVQTVE